MRRQLPPVESSNPSEKVSSGRTGRPCTGCSERNRQRSCDQSYCGRFSRPLEHETVSPLVSNDIPSPNLFQRQPHPEPSAPLQARAFRKELCLAIFAGKPPNLSALFHCRRDLAGIDNMSGQQRNNLARQPPCGFAQSSRSGLWRTFGLSSSSIGVVSRLPSRLGTVSSLRVN
jgi:hypothetical protein